MIKVTARNMQTWQDEMKKKSEKLENEVYRLTKEIWDTEDKD